jgi:hypothetical protein
MVGPVPVPLPLLVILFAIVGFGAVFQHTPFTVTGAPPSELIVPPLLALVAVMVFIANVFPITGAVAEGPGLEEGAGDLLQPLTIKIEIKTIKIEFIFIQFSFGTFRFVLGCFAIARYKLNY